MKDSNGMKLMMLGRVENKNQGKSFLAFPGKLHKIQHIFNNFLMNWTFGAWWTMFGLGWVARKDWEEEWMNWSQKLTGKLILWKEGGYPFLVDFKNWSVNQFSCNDIFKKIANYWWFFKKKLRREKEKKYREFQRFSDSLFYFKSSKSERKISKSFQKPDSLSKQ